MIEVSAAGVKFVHDFITGISARFSSNKRSLFEDHVDPLFMRMKVIHEDYLKGFHEAKRLIQERDKPTTEVIKFLEDRRLFLYVEREMTETLAVELKIGRSMLRREPGWTAVEEFCRSVISYFHAAGTVGSVSWFTDYLTHLKLMSKYDYATWEDTRIGGDPNAAMLQGIDNIISQRLPKAFRPILDGYAALKIELL